MPVIIEQNTDVIMDNCLVDIINATCMVLLLDVIY